MPTIAFMFDLKNFFKYSFLAYFLYIADLATIKPPSNFNYLIETPPHSIQLQLLFMINSFNDPSERGDISLFFFVRFLSPKSKLDLL